MWNYAVEHKGKMPENCSTPDFPAQLWKSPDELGSPYVYLAPDSWGFWQQEPRMEDVKFGYATRPQIVVHGTYQVFVGDPRRYILVYEPPVFGDDRFVVTSTGHILKLKTATLASRINFEAEELGEALVGPRRHAVTDDPATEKTQIPDDPIACGRKLVVAVKIWSSDAQGSYPKNIEELVRQAILEPDMFYKLNWREWIPAQIKPWIYDNSLNDSSHGDLPLLISPSLKNGDRIVAFNGARVEKITAEQFQEWIKKWKNMFRDSNEPWPESLEGL